MAKLSIFGDVWLTTLMICNHYNVPQIDPPLRWGKHPVHKEKPINTSFPLLYLSNTLDPVTPLSAALKMAVKFKDAGLVEQKAMGHCTLAATSFCTFDHIRKYFTEGKVPRAPVPGKKGKESDWERCEAIDRPFKPMPTHVVSAMSAEEMKVAEAAKKLQSVLRSHHTKGTNVRNLMGSPYGVMGQRLGRNGQGMPENCPH
jgi:hypothetical protein